MSSVRLLVLVLLAWLLGGCSDNVLYRTVRSATGLDGDVDGVALNPDLRYLRVTTRGRTALMVLGYLEPHPDGDIEVWYSRLGEVLRLQHGRIVATAGLETDWVAVRTDRLPAWRELAARDRFSYRRERDEMPGYRFGITEELRLQRMVAPRDSQLAGLHPRDLIWFEEIIVTSSQLLPEPSASIRPSARYAVRADNPDQVVYADQCLAPSLCLAWQRWPAVAP